MNSENRKPADREILFGRIVNVSILVFLILIAGLLASLNWRLSRQQETALSSPPASAPSAPASVAEPEPVPAAAPAPAPAAKATPAPKKNYTEPAPRSVAESVSAPEPSMKQDAARATEPIETEALIATTASSVAAIPALESNAAQLEPEPATAAAASSPDASLAASTASAAAPEPAIDAPAPAAVPEPVVAYVPAGTVLTVRLTDTLSTRTSRPGDYFTATLDDPIFLNGRVAVPRGASVEGVVAEATPAGRVAGVSELALELESLLLPDGDWHEVISERHVATGESTRKQDLAKVGIGAAIGAAIGAIAGGRKGAGIGAATGAGAGGAEVLTTRGEPVTLGPESRLPFTLRTPLEFELPPPGPAWAPATQPPSISGPPSDPYSQRDPYSRAPYPGDPSADDRPRLERRYDN